MQTDRVRPVIDPKTYALWKKYRASDSWRGEPKYFKEWLKSRERRKRIDWKDIYSRDVLKQGTLEIDGFRVVVKVRHDEISNVSDSDCYGSYDDSPEDHYAIDRLQGEEPSGWGHSRDPRKRYYNEPRHNAYEEQRGGWLEVCKPETVATSQAMGRKLATNLNGFEKGRKLSAEDVKSLSDAKYIAVPVDGRVVRRCRYDGVSTMSKSADDLEVRENIRKAQEILDGWYSDQWCYYDVDATAYMGEVELGSAGCMGIDSIDEDYVDDRALELAEEAVHEAREAFEKIRGTADTRCELIGEISKASETADLEDDEGLDAWLGFLYAKIATGDVLDLTDAPPAFDAFFDRHADLKKRTRLYVNGLEDE